MYNSSYIKFKPHKTRFHIMQGHMLYSITSWDPLNEASEIEIISRRFLRNSFGNILQKGSEDSRPGWRESFDYDIVLIKASVNHSESL